MPWSKENLPDSVKNKNWSAHQVEVFVKAANAALEEYGDDGKAIATGISAADKATEKSNANQWPKVYYCRHMQPGVCGYGTETVLVDTDALKRMIGNDAIGKPVYVLHNDNPSSERLAKLQEESHGYITDSFYNELDGWAWFKFLVVDDAGHAAIARGWKVSNAYLPTEWGKSGTKNNVPYDREIVNGAFTHLAIVPDPRYEEADVFTPEQFRAYQEAKKRELDELQNSKSKPSGGKKMFKIFKTKREEVNSIDADAQIELEGGQVVTVGEMMNAVKKNAEDEAKKKADKEKEEKDNAAKKNSEKINGDSMVECEGEKMPLKELVGKYNAMQKKNAEESEANKKKDKEEESGEEGDKKNSEKDDEKENEKKDEEEEKANAHFRELQNAAHKGNPPTEIMETNFDKLRRGAQRYGSGKAA